MLKSFVTWKLNEMPMLYFIFLVFTQQNIGSEYKKSELSFKNKFIKNQKINGILNSSTHRHNFKTDYES